MPIKHSFRPSSCPALWQLLLLALCAFLCSTAASAAQAAPADGSLPEPAAPYLASITSNGASLLVQQEIPVRHSGAEASVCLLLPKDASSMHFSVQDAVIADRSIKKVSLPGCGSTSALYASLTARKKSLAGEVLWLQTKVAQAEGSSAASLNDDMRAACTRLVEAKAELEEVGKSLASLPEPVRDWQLVTIRLLKAENAKSVQVRYGYTLAGCTWKPAYTVSCSPSAKKPINIRLEANITQPSGLDWKDTQIELVSGSVGSSTLPDVPKWLIGSDRDMAPEAAPLLARMAAPASLNKSSARDDQEALPPAGSSAASALDTSKSYIVWKPVLKGLAQGSSRVLLAEAEWQEKLVWTARPLNNDARVFICAEHALSAAEAVWPAGPMQMDVDGISAGSSYFRPRAGKVLLSFGNDPRVQLTAETEPRKSGQQGFIGKKQVWEWAWNYTVKNNREEEIAVRVERPLPCSTDEEIEASFTSTPKAVEDKKEKKLVWNLTAAAGSSASIKHEVKVTAPKDKPVNPVEP